MAYFKIFPLKATVKKAIDYISNPAKTDEQLLASTYGCSLESAAMEFRLTQEMGKRNVMEKGDNLAFHMIQSFKPGEISDPQFAHDIGKEFADKVLKGKYEYVITTHVDKGHIHNHIIFNATSFIDYHKYTTNKRNYYKLRNISDKICKEHGLSVITPETNKGRSYKEDMELKRGTSWKAQLKVAIDKAIWSSVTYEEFLMKMHSAGYEIRQGKYIAFRAPEQKNFTNAKTLGAYYTDEKLLERIAKNRNRLKIPRQATREVRLFVDISNYIVNGNRAGFEKWAKLNNLKEAAKTFNYLSDHGLLIYEDFQNHVTDVNSSIIATNQEIHNLETDLQRQQLIEKHCNTYRECKKIVDAGKKEPNQRPYRAKYKYEYKLHASSKDALHELGIGKLPSPSRLSATIAELESKISALAKEKAKLEKELQTLQTISQNLEHMTENSNLQKEKSPSSVKSKNELF